MAATGTGIGNLGTELLWAEPGMLLGPQNRYRIIRQHHSTENTPFIYGHSTYVAVDQKTSRYIILRSLGKEASTQNEAETSFPVVQKISSISDASDTILLPIDSFTSQDQFLCLVYEIYGPELYYLINSYGPANGVFPSSWISKVLFDVLQSLDFLHSNGIVHGSVELWSLVITYPQLESADGETVEAFFGQEENAKEPVIFNQTGTGASDEPDSSEFTVKLQNFRRAFHTGDGSPEAINDYIQLDCPPPELVVKGQISEKTDIWNLGIIFANLLSATPEFDSLIGGRGGSPQERLVRAENLLGPIPAAYRGSLPSVEEGSLHDSSPLDKLYGVIKNNLEVMLADEESDDEEELRDVFSEKELLTAVDLLKNLLNFDPEKRFSAKQALEHDFFQNGGGEMEE